jgi:hypothetical protein
VVYGIWGYGLSFGISLGIGWVKWYLCASARPHSFTMRSTSATSYCSPASCSYNAPGDQVMSYKLLKYCFTQNPQLKLVSRTLWLTRVELLSMEWQAAFATCRVLRVSRMVQTISLPLSHSSFMGSLYCTSSPVFKDKIKFVLWIDSSHVYGVPVLLTQIEKSWGETANQT